MAQLKDTVVQGSLRVTDTIFSTNLNLSSLTASYAVVTDGSKNLISRAITNNTSASAITASTNLITANTLAYWNGAYSGTSSRLTILGTISTGTWNATTIGVGYGGTGTQTAPTQGGIIFGSSASAYGCTSAGTSGQLLQSAGTDTPTWITATDSNTASTIVKRDASGNFSAGTITADLIGTADYAHSLWQRFSLTKGTNPSDTTWLSNWFNYQSGTTVQTVDRIGGGIESAITATGQSLLYLRAYNYISGSASNNYICIYANQDGAHGYEVANQANFRSAISAPSTTGGGASGTWGINITGKATYVSIRSRLNADANAMNFNPNADGVYGLSLHIMDSTSRTKSAANSPSFDSTVLELPWDWGGYNGQIALSNTTQTPRMQIRSASHTDKGEGASPRYVPSYSAWREVVTATKATQVGGGTQPVYISNTGAATACTTYANATVGSANKIVIAGGTGATYYNVIGVPSYSASAQSVYVSSPVKVNNVGVTCAIWNDFAEYRESEIQEPGRVLISNGKGQMILCNQRLVAGAKIISDTFGFSVGRSNIAKTPLGIVGRVLAYTYQDRNNYNVGDAVCAAPNGTIDIMTREEIIQYPDRIIGIVDEIPDYEIWNPTFTNKDSNGNESDCHTTEIPVNGRIWIYVK